MNVYLVKTGSILPLGKQGENLARKIQFDISRWIGTLGPGTVQLLHQRSGDEAPYPVAVGQAGNLAVWTVTNADTAAAGTGRAELQYYVGDALAKSETWMTKVLPALGDASETPPEAQQGWVDQVLAQVARITGMTAQAVELPAGSAPTADYTDGVLTIGIPLGGDVSDAQIAQAVAEYLAKNPIAETDPTVPDWAKQPDKPSYTADEVGALSSETLPEAINTALAQAKESGEFDGAAGQDGAPGQDGITPTVGANGNWYVGQTDTGVAATGHDGADGKSAYQYAVEGGYTGTEEAFAEKLAWNDVYAGQGYSNTKVTFDRLPISFSTPLKYQGWVGNSIVRYKNNYAELVYLRDGHNGSTKNTVCVFFDGYDIDRVEQCYFDGEAGYENNIGSICVYEMDGIYYTPKYDTTTMYQSTDLINWTTSPNVVSPTITPWGIWNIDGVLYAGDDGTRNTIYVSSDGGKNWQTITIASSYELSEGAFTSVGDKILCFFGKNWTTSTETSESGYAEMLVYDGTTWSEPKTTNIICNYGNAAGWFDGKLVHVVAKSRRYHLNNGNNGDGSQLQHYCATPEKALQGEFEFIQRIDRNRGDEEGAIAIDSTSVSICINDDGTGLLVSPVSAQSDIMQHSFYSINALMQTNIANKHENEIANYKNKYLLNGIISSGGAKVKHVLQIANGELDTYGVAGTDYAQSANITLATDGTYINASSAYSTVGSVGDGMVCIKPLYDVFAPVLIGYKDGNNGYVWARTAGWGVAVLGVWTSISRSTVHNVLYCVVNDGVPLFYFDSIYGLIKCVPYTWKSVSIANAKGTSSPCVSAQANNLQFTNLEYYGI